MFSLFVSTILHGVLVTFITLVLTLYLYFKWRYSYWSGRGVTAPPCTFPFGNLTDVALGRVSVQEMFKKLYTDLEPKGIKYSGYYFFHKPVLVVLDLELIKSILVQDFAHFTNHGLLDQKDYDVFSGHIFGAKGVEWKKMREKLTPLFSSGKLKTMFSTIENCSAQLASLINYAAENSEKLNINDISGRYTTDIISSVSFGIESNTLKNPTSDFRKYGERASGNGDLVGALNLVCQVLIPDIFSLLKIPIFPKDVTTFFRNIVQSTIKYREENQIIRKDFMQLMIQLKNNINISDKVDGGFNLEANSNSNKTVINDQDKYSLSVEDITAQTLLFFVAGYDTSSLTIAFCIYELAHHQDIQETLRNEINTVLNKHEGLLSYNAIMEMPYMEKCIRETLRKYPLFSSLFRNCTKTYQVQDSDLIIEKDMIVMIPVQELHYDPKYYPNPEKFDPERFSNENISTRNTFTWLPFGKGPRECIARRLGMIIVKVALVKLLENFRYSLDSRTAYPVKKATRSFAIAAEGGIWLNVEKIVN